MTNKETIIWLEGMKEGVFPWSDEVMNEVCDTAISALSVPKGEYINKFAVLTEMDKRHAEGDFITKGFINSLPTISVPEREKGEWIPVSERLPKIADVYRVTRYYPNNVMNPNYIVDACAFDGSDTWYDDNRINHERAYVNNVIAWQENPEPYKAEREDKE